MDGLKLKASSLIETTIAMVVIMLSFSVAMIVFGQMNDGYKDWRLFKAKEIVSDEFRTMNIQKIYVNEEKTIKDQWKLISTVIPLEGYDHHLKLKFQVLDDNGTELYTTNYLVNIDE